MAATVPVTPEGYARKVVGSGHGNRWLGDDVRYGRSVRNQCTGGGSKRPAAATVGRRQAGGGKPAADAATADAAPSSTLAATVSAHEHSPAAGRENALADAADPSTQAIGTTQPQLNSPAATAAPGGALTVTAAANGPVPLSGLAVEIAASAKSGKSRFEIRLDPADLGRIDVRIDVDRNGQVTSHLTVEKPETLSMLRQDAPQLQRALDDAGFKTGDGGLQFSLRDQSSSGPEQRQRQPAATRSGW